MCVICVLLCQGNKYVCRQRQGAVKNEPTCIELNTGSFQMGCQVSSATSAPPFELCFHISCCVEQT